ncbi:MAG: hypothetical protein D6738_10995 [Acidobacteria bacterium]|nr:MAG: hypothetical protein D6738_10995 [Acidobacteriota bacterium]
MRLQATLVHALGSAGHLDRAREVADRALALVPDSPLLLAERARIEALAEDDAAAARWLARAQAAGISAGLARRLAAEPAFRALGEDSATMRLVQSLAPAD